VSLLLRAALGVGDDHHLSERSERKGRVRGAR
jgi:hypothetical protein